MKLHMNVYENKTAGNVWNFVFLTTSINVGESNTLINALQYQLKVLIYTCIENSLDHHLSVLTTVFDALYSRLRVTKFI
jgi:hypothetical protein